MTALPLGLAFLFGRRAEDLAGMVVVLIIAGSAALAGYESVLRLPTPDRSGISGSWRWRD